MESPTHADPGQKCEAASTPDGRHFHAFDFGEEERLRLRKLLFAVLTDEVSFDPHTKDGSSMSNLTSDEFDSSDWSATSEASTTGSDLSDGEYSDSDFSDDDAE